MDDLLYHDLWIIVDQFNMDVDGDSYDFVVMEEFYMSPGSSFSNQQQITINSQK